MKIASFFAGVGGIDLGFRELGELVYANEFDPHAATTFEYNFDITVDRRDVQTIDPSTLPKFDILLGGFPCQAFSVAGYREGFKDKKGRGELFFTLANIMEVIKPKIIFLENVKNLVGHDHGNTFSVILQTLEELGYYVKYQVLNAMNYGDIPQNRERIYIVGFLEEESYKNFEFPKPIPLTKSIRDLINGREEDPSLFYTVDNCSFYEELEASIIKTNTIYQWRRKYVRENKSSVCPTLTANMGTGGHNVPLIKTRKGIRKLSPRECFLFQGFPKSYKLPKIAKTHLYKQAGNSVVVPVIERIAMAIQDAVERS